VARPPEFSTLPAETLLGLLVEQSASGTAYKVWDHALDTVRFIDARFKCSIAVRIKIPSELSQVEDAGLWFGLQGVATPEQVECAQRIGRITTQWLSTYSPVVEALIEARSHGRDIQHRISEMVGVAHDARAPLSSIRYLLSDLKRDYPSTEVDVGRLSAELSYVDTLLGMFAPEQYRDPCQEDELVDICQLVTRVCERFYREASSSGAVLTFSRPSDAYVHALIAEVDLERILSNVIGNAVKYSGKGQIVVRIDDDSQRELKIVVSDTGPGIPELVIKALDCEEGIFQSAIPTRGWGIGLRQCKKHLEKAGGDLHIGTSDCGSIVSVILRRGGRRNDLSHMCSTPSPFSEDRQVEDFQRDYGVRGHSAGLQMRSTLIVVDDDLDHTISLQRVLNREGLDVVSFASVEQALGYMRGAKGCGVICDATMPDGGAERLLGAVRAKGSLWRCAAMSGDSNEQLLYRLAALGAREFFPKPVEIERLVAWATNGAKVQGLLRSSA
jgi:signal transduction histidine kinase/ActR/RegA family two-component response regulator